VIWIDVEGRQPIDTDIPGWTPWSVADWNAWLAESKQLTGELARLNAVGKIKERNKFIDENSAHWGKLKPWLSALSGGKCWFTEARDIASHRDVEHFRPKKSAKNAKGPERDGYWWLAFDYVNFRFAGSVPNRKKGSWFPLRRGSKFSTFQSQCEDDETAHFLDPTNAHDVTLISFDETGSAIPTPGIACWEWVRAKRTIDRLKLTDHPDLAEARRKLWQKMDRTITAYYQAKAQARTPHAAAARQKMTDRAREILMLTRPSEELSSVARWCVQFRNDPQLMKLIG